MRRLDWFGIVFGIMAVLSVSSRSAQATDFMLDNFSVDLNGTPLFDDPFGDDVPPPNAPNFLPSGPAASYLVGGDFTDTESGGKLTLNVDNGGPGISPTGVPTRILRARLLTSTNPASSRNLGPNDTFMVSGIFDLTLPGPKSEAFRISLTDRTMPQGPNDTTNDTVRLTVLRSRAISGEVIIALLDLDFVEDTTTVLETAPIDLTGNPDQIRLTLAKLDAATSQITASFSYLKNGVELSSTTFATTATIFTGGTLPDGTPFPAEQHTRAQFDAFFIPGVPEEQSVAQLTTGSPVSLSQTVDTPSTPFNLEFDYKFETITGELTVSLDSTILGTISAPPVLDPSFQTASFPVNDSSLLDKTGLLLKFSLDGPTGSTLLLDNVVFPGLANGDFQAGTLTAWDTEASGSGLVGVLILPASVAVDIKPQSCPNPLNTNKKGVIPVAILGSSNLDVLNIDITSIQLEGVAPIRSAVEDVSTPFEPFIGKGDTLDCNDSGPDGFDDLILKFDAQEVIAAIGSVNDGDVLALTLTGELLDGTSIQGEDVVVILDH